MNRKKQPKVKRAPSAQPPNAERRRLQTPSRQDGSAPFVPIVGIGASAGGLEAFTRLLRRLPLDTGLGFVLVQHLDPEHESALTQILTRATNLPVREVSNQMRVEADHVYIIPPNTILTIDQGRMKLEPRRSDDRPQRTIDVFFESLAHDQRGRAIGVILSGTASDGSVGLEAIKAEGGITFAQDESAAYDSMPRNAVAVGCVDFVLSPEDIAKELGRIATHPYVGEFLSSDEDAESWPTALQGQETPGPSSTRGLPHTRAMRARSAAVKGGADRTGKRAARNGFNEILWLLHKHTGVDFSLYKLSTIRRRVIRRMVLTRHETLEDYSLFLRHNPKELDALYADALISVTNFFRNRDVFDTLEARIIPDLLRRPGDQPSRVWVVGCSSGQEVYSIAMAFMEAMDQVPRMRAVNIFATDLNIDLLETGRRGFYTKTFVQDVSPERLRRFFYQENGGYRIVKELRDMVIFARQNFFADPPFSRVDLISCRNVLIYVDPSMQKRAIQTFHFALKPGGYLLLGTSESIGSSTDLFEPVDRKHKLYQKKAAPTAAYHLPVQQDLHENRVANRSQQHERFLSMRGGPGRSDAFESELTAQQEADRITITQFAPPTVLIDSQFQILQFRGTTKAYLEPPKGKANFDLLKMAREGLLLPLRAAINQAKKSNAVARRDHVRVEQNGRTRTVNLKVVPLRHVRERCFLVVFEDPARMPGPPSARPRGAAKTRRAATQESRRLGELTRDLADTREYLHSIQEQYEVSHQGLQASNEEVQSANEELQSLNEELETSKEELESANEELITLNDEMANRNNELTRLNADWLNLNNSVNLSVVVLARDLTIRWVSAQAETLLGLRSHDVSRPIGSIRHNLRWGRPSGEQQEHGKPEVREDEGRAPEALDVPLDMESVAAEVIGTVRARECEVCSPGDQWYQMRVRPYITLDNKVDGAVMVLMDITDLKRNEREITHAREYAEAIIETGHEPMLVLDGALCVERANRAFYRTFEISPTETVGRTLFELKNGQWDIPDLRRWLADILSRRSNSTELQITYRQLGLRTLLINAHLVEDHVHGRSHRILFAITDVTERLQSEERLRALAKELTLTEQRERRRLAELHDYLAQILALGMIKLTQAKQQAVETAIVKIINEVDKILEQSLAYTRNLVAQLCPPILHTFGLSFALRWLAEQMESQDLVLTVEVEEESPALQEDHAMLVFHVVRELLLNVAKHAKTTRAKIVMTTVEGNLRITVSDEGVGFDVDATQSPAAATEEPGSHFGLFSIREQLLGMGGRLQLVSRPGEGTQATLIVPLQSKEHSESSVHDVSRERIQESPHSTGTASNATEDALQAKKPTRILLVDDHAMVREGLRTMLEGYTDMEVVGEAGDGVQAVEAIDRCQPDVVVMDINMPNMNGIDATVQIKTRYPYVVVIGLSVQTNAIAHEEMLRAGAATLIGKEVAVEELHRTIRRVLEAHPS